MSEERVIENISAAEDALIWESIRQMPRSQLKTALKAEGIDPRELRDQLRESMQKWRGENTL